MSDDTSRGIYRKYRVERTDGSSAPGGKHEQCAYFVLDLEHDEFAVPALKAYARACRKGFPDLAADILRIIETTPMQCGCREASCPHSLSRALMPQTPNEMAGYLLADEDEP